METTVIKAIPASSEDSAFASETLETVRDNAQHGKRQRYNCHEREHMGRARRAVDDFWERNLDWITQHEHISRHSLEDIKRGIRNGVADLVSMQYRHLIQVPRKTELGSRFHERYWDLEGRLCASTWSDENARHFLGTSLDRSDDERMRVYRDALSLYKRSSQEEKFMTLACMDEVSFDAVLRKIVEEIDTNVQFIKSPIHKGIAAFREIIRQTVIHGVLDFMQYPQVRNLLMSDISPMCSVGNPNAKFRALRAVMNEGVGESFEDLIDTLPNAYRRMLAILLTSEQSS